MSDESPWQPPSHDRTSDRAADDGAADTGAVGPSEAEQSDPSPWSREADDGDAPRLPEPSSGAAPDPAAASTPPPADAPPVPPVVGDDRDDGPAGDASPSAAPSAAPSSGRRSVFVAVAAAAVIAIGLAGIFAVRQFTGETAGGADTPDQLVDELMAAVEGEDVLGMIDVMLPGERESLGEPMIDTVGELQRLEILSSDLDLSSLAGFDIEVERHTAEVEQLGVDDIVMLHMSADVVISVDGAAVPIGDLITDRLPDDELTEMRGSKMTETDTIDVSMAAVQSDGAWYLSLFHTVAELARTEAGVGDLPADGIGAVGADTPEGVVDLFADHLASVDLRGMLQLLDPAEAQALQRYAPLFLDEAEQAISEQAGAVEIRVTDTDVRVDGDGSARTLFVDGFAIEADLEGTSVSARLADGCVTVDYSDEFGGSESIEQCGGTTPDTSAVEEMAGMEVPDTVDEFIAAFTDAFSDMEPAGIEVRERDGQWFVSPIATGSEAMLAVLRALDRSELDELIDLGTVAADDFLGMAFGMVPGSGDGAWVTDDVVGPTDDDWTDTSGSMDGTGDLETGDDGEWTEYEETEVDKCYSVEGAAEATACFEDLIASGAAEEWEMPAALRAPECGLTELLWTGEMYGLSDDEFTTAMTQAATCFDGLVADGYDEFLVPYEVDNLDCFEGRNPYQVFEEDYNDRVFDCAFGE